MTDDLRWGIIGCGDVTEVKSGPAFNKVPHSSLVAVMRRSSAKAQDYAQRHNVPRWYDDASQLINDPGVNAIYVATPPGSHEKYAIAALEAGKPVYLEKPMSTDVDSCLRINNTAERTGGKLTVAHYRRALPMFNHIKDLLQSKTIGEVRTVRLSMLQPDQSSLITKTQDNWRVDPSVAGAGLFYDLAPHQIDILLWMFGNADQYAGASANQAGLYAAEDVVTGVMTLPGKVLFSGQWCFTVAPECREDLCEITGSAGKISFPIFGNWVKLFVDGVEERIEFTHPQHIQQPMIEKVVNYFRGDGSNPCLAADAIASMKVMEAFAYGGLQTSKSS